MFGSQNLDVLIGLILVFLFVSVMCSAIREGIEAWLKTRASYLEHGIRALLHDRTGDGVARKLYNHPLIEGLFSGDYVPGSTTTRPSLSGGNLPSYIPAKNFAEALFDIAARGPDTNAVSSGPNASSVSLDSIRENIENIDNPRVQRILLSAVDNAQGDFERAKKNIEEWYDSGMDRVSGWYKRATQWTILVIGLTVAVGLNINAITIFNYLSRNDTARQVIVQRAANVVDAKVPTENQESAEPLNSLNLPIGWSGGWEARRVGATQGIWNDWIGPVLGWLIIGLAATMGAPFWFDLLNKFMVIRSTVKPHEKSPEEGSEDRADKTTPPEVPVAPVPPVSNATPGPAVRPGASIPDWEKIPGPTDPEDDVDGCDVEVKAETTTSDENLPAAEGGIK
jgi:hypothetical protein